MEALLALLGKADNIAVLVLIGVCAGLGLFSLYLHAGWKMGGFLEGARPGASDAVSTGNFIGIGLRTDDFGDN